MILRYGNFLRGGKRMADKKFSRRDILKIGTAGALGIAGSMYLNQTAPFKKVANAENHQTNHNKSFAICLIRQKQKVIGWQNVS